MPSVGTDGSTGQKVGLSRLATRSDAERIRRIIARGFGCGRRHAAFRVMAYIPSRTALVQSQDMVPKAISIFVIGYLILFWVFVLTAGALAITNIWNTAARAKWPAVLGQVTRVVTMQYSVPCTQTYGNENGCEVVITHNPAVEFEYTVGGTRYASIQRFYLSAGGIFSSLAFSTYPRYVAGQSAKVYYNPDDPTQAVVERDISPFDYFLLFFAMIYAWFGIDIARTAKTKRTKVGHTHADQATRRASG